MAMTPVDYAGSNHPERDISTAYRTPEPVGERKTTAVSRRRPARRKRPDAGPFEAEVGSFRLHLAAEGKAGRTLDTYCEAVRWFAAAHLLCETGKSRRRGLLVRAVRFLRRKTTTAPRPGTRQPKQYAVSTRGHWR
jgi:hypothetical protein